MPLSVLIAERELALREFLICNLQFHGVTAHGAASAMEVAVCLSRYRPDAILFDGVVPVTIGLERCRLDHPVACCEQVAAMVMIRSGHPKSPSVTCPSESLHRITAPFRFPDLIEALTAMVGRSDLEAPRILERAGVRMDSDARRATYLDRPISLRPAEMDFLQYFLEHPSSLIVTADLMTVLSKGSKPSNGSALQRQVSRLRCALESVGASHLIRTLSPLGYAFDLAL